MGSLLTGPLGVLRSAESRFFPPSLRLPLWHCSDTGCRSPHNVLLMQTDVPVVRIEKTIRKSLRDDSGPPSEWSLPLSRVFLRPRESQAEEFPYFACLFSSRSACWQMNARSWSHQRSERNSGRSYGISRRCKGPSRLPGGRIRASLPRSAASNVVTTA